MTEGIDTGAAPIVAATPVVRHSAGGRWGRLAAGNWAPPAITLLLTLAVMGVCARYPPRLWFSPNSWFRYDSVWYRNISQIGYVRTATCNPYNGKVMAVCGNEGWFPGFPLAGSVVRLIPGISITASMLIACWIAWYLMLAALWRLVADAVSTATRWLCLFAGAWVTGSVYFTALFPLSQTVGALLWCLYFAFRSRSRWRAPMTLVCGAIAGYSYLPAIALAPALLMTAVISLAGRERLLALLGAAGAALGLGLVLLQMQLQARMWNAYFLFTKERYDVGLNNPITVLTKRVSQAWKTGPASKGPFFRVAGFQSILAVLLLVACVAIVLAVGLGGRPRRKVPGGLWLGALSRRVVARIDPLDVALAALAVGLWLFPFIAGGQSSSYRSEAFLIMAIPAFRRLPPWYLIPVLIAELWLLWEIVPYFVNKAMV